ncbi:hypothetical protein T484DRAFT_1849785, partial [Baffinella frigidus]
ASAQNSFVGEEEVPLGVVDTATARALIGIKGAQSVKLLGVVDTATARALIGIKGAQVRSMETSSGARIRFALDNGRAGNNDNGRAGNNTMTLRGNQEQRDAARTMIEGMLVQLRIEDRHSLVNLDIRALVGPGGVVVRGLEKQSGASISVVPDDPPYVSIRGDRKNRTRAWELIQGVFTAGQESLYKIPEEIPLFLCWPFCQCESLYEIPLGLRRVVIGINGSNVKGVEEATGARVTMFWDDDKAKARIAGTDEQRNAAWEEITKWVSSDECLLAQTVSEDTAIELMRHRAKRIRDVEGRTATSISVMRNQSGECVLDAEGRAQTTIRGVGESRAEAAAMAPQITIRGVGESRAEAAAMIQTVETQSPSTYVLSEILGVESCSILDVRRLIGRKGATVAHVEKECGATISFDPTPPPTMTIMGSHAARDRVLAMIKADFAAIDEEVLPLGQDKHGSLIGVGGRTIKRLERDSGAQVSFRLTPEAAMAFGRPSAEHGRVICVWGLTPEAAMVVRGTAEQRASAMAFAKNILENDGAEPMIMLIERRHFGLLIGKEGRVVRDVEKESGARIQVLTESNFEEVARLGLDANALFKSGNGDREQAVVVIKGSEQEREVAKGLVLLAIDAQATDRIPVTHAQREYLWASNSQRVREIEQAHSVQLRAIKPTEGMVDASGLEVNTVIEIRGRGTNRVQASEMLMQVLGEDEEIREMVGVDFPLLAVRLVIGARGQKVKQMEVDSGARIRFETGEPVSIVVRGSPEARLKAWALIAEAQ